MGNGATNPSELPGMLPAASDSSPYVITYSGLLGADSGPVWRAFDQVPVYGSTSDYPNPEVFLAAADSPASLCAIMVDLGDGNSRCFDKLAFCNSDWSHEYFMPTAMNIQGSNDPAAAVEDAADSELWDVLYAEAVEVRYGDYGDWREFVTWTTSESYRYYRIIVVSNYYGIPEGWLTTYDEDHNILIAVAEYMFVEEVTPPKNAIELLLHCNGTNTGVSFPDSSPANHTVVPIGAAQTATATPKFGSASVKFGTNGDSLSIATCDLWSLLKADFTVHFWVKIADNFVDEQELFSQYTDENNFIKCTYSTITQVLTFKVVLGSEVKMWVSTSVALPFNVWTHVAVVGTGSTNV